MSFDALNRYSANHKPWDHVGNIIPDIEHSEGERPAVAYQVAPWLPVQFYDKYYENWVVVMPGKAVALDPQGYVMPAEYCSATAALTYTSDDIVQGTIDICTGKPVTTARTVTFGYINGVYQAGAATTGGVSTTCGFMGLLGVAWPGANGSTTVTKRYPIGVAPYAYLQNCGGDGFNPAQYTKHNYNMQHAVAVLCDYVIRLPLVPAAVLTETVNAAATGSALTLASGNVFTRANAILYAAGRYNTTYGTVPVKTTDTVIALALAHYPIAQNENLTTSIAMSSLDTGNLASAVLVTEVTSVSQVNAAGRYFVDYPAGVIFIYSADGAALPTGITGATTPTIQYFSLNSAPSSALLSKFACVLTSSTVIPHGAFLKYGASSNLVLADPASDSFGDIIGQVVGVEKWPLDGLDRVKTAFNPPIGTSSLGGMANGVPGSASANLGQLDRMPGSSTGGIPDLITFAGGADTVLIINLVSR